jgi:hypothetical protein
MKKKKKKKKKGKERLLYEKQYSNQSERMEER